MAVQSGTLAGDLTAAYKAAERSDDSSLETICKFWSSNEVAVPIDEKGYTILHFLAFYDNYVAVKTLYDKKLLKREQLEMRNVYGDTALHVASRFGRKNFVKEIFRNENNSDQTSLRNSPDGMPITELNLDLILFRNNHGETPIYVAAANGKKDMFDFLSSKVGREQVMEGRKDGCTILDAAVTGQYYGFALSILEPYPELGENEKGMKALYMLASRRTAFKCGTMYNIKNLSSSPFVPWRIVTLLFYCLCVSPVVTENPQNRTIGSSLRAGYTKLLRVIPFCKEASEAKEKHVYAKALAKKLIDAQEQWPHPYKYFELDQSQPEEHYEDDEAHPVVVRSNNAPDPLIEAIKNNIIDLVKMILDRFPDAANTFDQKRKNILHIAAETKETFMYEYLKERVSDKEKMLADVDCDGNTVLHLAAESGEIRKTMSGPLIGMAWDIFWYKHVKLDTPQPLIHQRNSKGLTAKKMFRDGHTQGLKESQEDIKKVNNGLMVVSVLISTINFAAIFTIPGGFNQVTGIPIFFNENDTLKKKELDLFLVYVGVSLLASLIALGTQLSIQLSRFRKIDFYYVLPFKFCLATTTLYYSTTFSITTCFQAYILEGAFKSKFILAIMVACLPATLVYFDLVYSSINYLHFPAWYNILTPPRQVGMHFLKKAYAMCGARKSHDKKS